MSLLHGNFRKKAIDIDYNAVGGGIANWIQGSNLNPDFRFGGFVMASFASQLSGVGFLAESAMDILTSTYGITMISNINVAIGGGSVGSTSTGIGFKVIPFAYNDFSGDGGSNQIGYTLSATQALSADDSVVVIAPKKYAVSGPVTSASNVSVHFLMFGWIVSTPFSFR